MHAPFYSGYGFGSGVYSESGLGSGGSGIYSESGLGSGVNGK